MPWKENGAVLQDCKNDAEYIVALHNSYEALRKAALDGERYRKAGEVLLESIKEHSCDGQEDCWVAMETYANTYRQAVEQKEV